MLVSLDTTEIVARCGDDGTQTTIPIASLEAGHNDFGIDAVFLPGLACGHFACVYRRFENALQLQGWANALHRHLVTLAQIASDHVAELQAETDADRPTFFYTITAVTQLVGVSSINRNRFAYDETEVISLLGAADVQTNEKNGLILLDGTDNDIAAFASQLYAAQADKDAAADRLKTVRDGEII